jgi:hypothetical protein
MDAIAQMQHHFQPAGEPAPRRSFPARIINS